MLGMLFGAVLMGSAAGALEAPAVTPPVQQLAQTHCADRPIQRTPGFFIPGIRRQVLEIDRSVAYSSMGPVCILSAGIADADNPYRSRVQTMVWQAKGPGQIFSNGVWHSPEEGGRFTAEVTHLLPGPSDQVAIIHSPGADDAAVIHAVIVAFDQDTGVRRNILDIADAGELEVRTVDGDVVIRGLDADGSCHLCGPVRIIRLHYDVEAGALALSNPTSENVQFYRMLVQFRKDANL